MNLKDINISPATRMLLEENGRSDCNRGIDMHTGWAEVAKGCGYDTTQRTPALEAYLDGYYQGTMPKQGGWTLIEILIVVAIIGIVASIILPHVRF